MFVPKVASAEELALFQIAPEEQKLCQTLSRQTDSKPTKSIHWKQWFWLNSFGGRLFWVILLGTLAGMTSMALLFGDLLKRQAEAQVHSSLTNKVNAISSVTESAETLASSLGVSAVTLHERKAQYTDTYRELVLQLFEQRPEFVVGLGLAQSKNGIIPDQAWMFPYYSVVNRLEKTTADTDTIQYEDFADKVGTFYPDNAQYRIYFRPQKKIWTNPHTEGRTRHLTYYHPLFDQDGNWLGTSLVDINTAHFNNLLDETVFQNAGQFLLLNRSGMLIADPKNPFTTVQNYKDIPGIQSIWEQLDNEASGFLHSETGYWAYSIVPGKDWVLLGFVPYKAIFGPIIKTTVVITGLLSLLIAMIIFLAVRRLNQRLKPILLQANQFTDQDDALIASLTEHDELDQLSLAFFSILHQLNKRQDTICRHKEIIINNNHQIDQLTERIITLNEQLDNAGKGTADSY